MRSLNRRRTPLVAVAVSLAVVAAACEARAAESEGLRVLTYNVAQLPIVTGDTLVIPECSSGFFGVSDDDCVGLKLADALLQSDYDVILLNELFDDGVRATLTSRLSGRYPFWANHAGENQVLLVDVGPAEGRADRAITSQRRRYLHPERCAIVMQ